MRMTPAQLNRIMASKGLMQLDLSRLFELTPRQIRRWQHGEAPIPAAAGMLLRMLDRGVVDVQTIERFRSGKAT